MDDFLYIIIGIVWVVYSLYTNKQKQQKKRLLEEQRKSQSSPQPEPQSPRSIFEQLLDPEPQIPEPINESVPESYTESKSGPFDDYLNPSPNYIPEISEEEPYRSKYQSLEIIKDEVSASYFENQYESRGDMNYYDNREMAESTHNEVALQDQLSEEFDLRKAVIYSEILNPRYI
ncbi:MAG: hypothetical protein RBS07_02105 [Lentimicrobium sp.]|jgi:hypothetical protein|nr:hypothetical protein [Lentimicrobium sp.]